MITNRVDFSNYIKPLLRGSGFALMIFFLARCIFTFSPLSAFSQPAQVLKFTEIFLQFSNLLAIAVLMLLLSLADHILPIPHDMKRKRIRRRDKLIMRGKTLVGLLAIFYFILIPLSLSQASTLRNVRIRNIESQSEMVGEGLKRIQSELNSNQLESIDMQTLQRRYSFLIGPGLPIESVQSIDDLRERAQIFSSKNKELKENQIANAQRVITFTSLRIITYAILFGLLFSYFWFYWPSARRLAKQDGRTQDSDVVHLLGVEEDAIHM